MSGETVDPTRSDVDPGRTLDKVVVIVGLPGVGKSTVGRRAAKKLGWNFVDLDAAVEARAGKTIREIFAEDGEAAFRDLESATLRECIDSSSPCIVATGGGVVLARVNREELKRADAVVWMTASVGELESRLAPRSGRGHRPLLDGDLLETLNRLDAERSDLYREVATDVLSTAGLAFDDVYSRLVELIETGVSA